MFENIWLLSFSFDVINSWAALCFWYFSIAQHNAHQIMARFRKIIESKKIMSKEWRYEFHVFWGRIECFLNHFLLKNTVLVKSGQNWKVLSSFLFDSIFSYSKYSFGKINQNSKILDFRRIVNFFAFKIAENSFFGEFCQKCSQSSHSIIFLYVGVLIVT